MNIGFARSLVFTPVILMAMTNTSYSDEGMWLFNNPPRKILKDKYNFEFPAAWLEHVQKSSVRFNSGGSGSFVSADGLVMTNHHVGAGALQKLSTKEKDYLKDGFYAKTLAEEFQSKDEELNVLMEIEDVTDQVKAAVKPGMTPAEAFKARRGIMNQIETESQKKTSLKSQVVTLYQGGQYHLYRFKRYSDVRLVFAPEQQIAFYGGEPDNFAYPRYDLDVCLFRVYENGKPAKIEHYFKWSKHGAADNELVFVPGHPGHTDRLNTVADLEYLRDIGFPYLLQRLNRWEVMLSVYSERSEDSRRKAKEDYFGVANSRKARVGGLDGLQDPQLMAKKIAQEKTLREAVTNNPKLRDLEGAWEVIAKLQKIRAANIRRYTALEGAAGFHCDLFGIARTLVRAAEEYAKPNKDRLRQFVESEKESLEQQLFSEQPYYPDFELAKLQDALGWLSEQLGGDDPLVHKVLAGKSPRERAVDLISGTKLIRPVKSADGEDRYVISDEVKKLYDGGDKAIAASNDPMILLARLVDPESRAVRKIMETEFDEPKRQAYDKIAKAKFEIEGTGSYPDATFTLRLAFGVVKGYEEDGKQIPYQTTFAGLYEKAKEQKNLAPYDLPPRWLERKGKLNLKTPFNFVCTADIIGGNSGSPVINEKAEIVGLIFDGNIQSLVLDFVYTEKHARAVSVSSPAIPEALRAVYDAAPLAQELETGIRP